MTSRRAHTTSTCPRAPILDADCTPSLEEHSGGVGVSTDLEVRAAQGGTQVRVRRATAAPIANGHVEAAKTFLTVTIQVLAPRVARLGTRRHPDLVQGIGESPVPRVERTRVPAVRIAAARA